MPKFVSPLGNIEIHNKKPEGYFTVEEWQKKHAVPPAEPDPETRRLSRIAFLKSELARLDAVYLTARVLAGLALGDLFSRERYEKHEAEAGPLRLELAELGKGA